MIAGDVPYNQLIGSFWKKDRDPEGWLEGLVIEGVTSDCLVGEEIESGTTADFAKMV